MQLIYIYLVSGFAAGFLIAWIIRTVAVANLKKVNKSLGGFLESEKLRKETLAKENTNLYERKKRVVEAYEEELKTMKLLTKRMDEDILLLQKDNEETEELLQSGLPVVHSLKLQLIEANNTIARYKAMLERMTVEKES